MKKHAVPHSAPKVPCETTTPAAPSSPGASFWKSSGTAALAPRVAESAECADVAAAAAAPIAIERTPEPLAVLGERAAPSGGSTTPAPAPMPTPAVGGEPRDVAAFGADAIWWSGGGTSAAPASPAGAPTAPAIVDQAFTPAPAAEMPDAGGELDGELEGAMRELRDEIRALRESMRGLRTRIRSIAEGESALR